MSVSVLPEDVSRPINIQELQQGDVKAFHRLYRALYADLVKLAFTTLVKQEEAPVVVNLAFVKCWLHSQKITSNDYVNAFMHITIRNLCQSFNSSGRRKTAHQQSVLQTILTSTGQTNSSHSKFLQQSATLTEDLKAAVTSVFVLYYERQLPVGEIAAETGSPVSTIQEEIDLACQMLHLIFLGQTNK